MHWPPDAIPCLRASTREPCTQCGVPSDSSRPSPRPSWRAGSTSSCQPRPARERAPCGKSAADFTSSLMSSDTPGKLTRTDINLHQITNGRSERPSIPGHCSTDADERNSAGAHFRGSSPRRPIESAGIRSMAFPGDSRSGRSGMRTDVICGPGASLARAGWHARVRTCAPVGKSVA